MSNVTIDGVEYAPVRPVGGEVRIATSWTYGCGMGATFGHLPAWAFDGIGPMGFVRALDMHRTAAA